MRAGAVIRSNTVYAFFSFKMDKSLIGCGFAGLPCEQSVGFSPEPGDVVAVRNRELRMACQPTGILPIKTEWLKNGVPLVSDARRSILRDGTLYFRRVVHRPSRNRSDAGRYHCVVSDKYGKIASRILTLTVVSGKIFIYYYLIRITLVTNLLCDRDFTYVRIGKVFIH